MQTTRQVFNSQILAILILIYSLSAACAQEPKKLPNDIKWMTKSIEYSAICMQTYRNAWQAVKDAAESQTQNWVVVLDIDETVLDNSPYAIQLYENSKPFTEESWAKWVYREEAALVPGAKAFIDSVRTLGPKAHIAYITNRLSEYDHATKQNLKKYGLFQEDDILLARMGSEDTKENRRRCLETGTDRCKKNGPCVILALVGDHIRDFVPVYGSKNVFQYWNNDLKEDTNWGKKYFMLPNPNYGAWQRDYR
ncbi:MAG: HAD family acid phosphatase [bacterium]